MEEEQVNKQKCCLPPGTFNPHSNPATDIKPLYFNTFKKNCSFEILFSRLTIEIDYIGGFLFNAILMNSETFVRH